jgi:hypothetical protein
MRGSREDEGGRVYIGRRGLGALGRRSEHVILRWRRGTCMGLGWE